MVGGRLEASAQAAPAFGENLKSFCRTSGAKLASTVVLHVPAEDAGTCLRFRSGQFTSKEIKDGLEVATREVELRRRTMSQKRLPHFLMFNHDCQQVFKN